MVSGGPPTDEEGHRTTPSPLFRSCCRILKLDLLLLMKTTHLGMI
jgi:hypothetical protein